jgi:phenylpropionate dioxygenase-like ring-hydroxylating dioxygenase large terminal subunit
VKEVIAGGSTDVQNGTTLPPRAYDSQGFFDLEVANIFKREWLCVGHVSQVQNLGDYFTLELLKEPMVIVRAKDRIRALSSVCRHRWAPVASGAGNAKGGFSCPFHKWSYGLDGQLRGAPLMDQAVAFDKQACRLPEFRTEIVEELGLIFVTFSRTVSSITERLQSLCQRAKEQGWDLKDQVVAHSLEQINQYNWKVQVETYVECYHHIGGHSTTLQKIMPATASWSEEDKGSWTICHAGLNQNLTGLTVDERNVIASFASGVREGEAVGHIVAIYPFTLVTFMQGGSDLRILSPVGPSETKSTILTLRQREQVQAANFDEWLADYLKTADIVNKEDNDINLMQQIGVRSAQATAGRFCHLETSAWHLAQFVRRRIQGGADP